VVCGGGYKYKHDLELFIENQNYKDIEITYSSGVISKIMEKTQLAISSNGRTVYELADMNIPSIIISNHKRENTHNFSKLENGFINMGIYKENDFDKFLKDNLIRLIDDEVYRKTLFQRIKRFNFRANKRKVLNKIMSLIES
jgi:spore coat polysaccharide biosynthesis predicted glycosyltransferase SpsG